MGGSFFAKCAFRYARNAVENLYGNVCARPRNVKICKILKFAIDKKRF